MYPVLFTAIIRCELSPLWSTSATKTVLFYDRHKFVQWSCVFISRLFFDLSPPAVWGITSSVVRMSLYCWTVFAVFLLLQF